MKDEYLVRKTDKLSYYINSITEEESKDIDTYVTTYARLRKDINKVNLNKECENRYTFKITDILAFGNTISIPSGILHNIIEKKVINLAGNEIRAYRCFNERKPTRRDGIEGTILGFMHNGIISHEDRLSSWNCLLQHIGKPKFCIIYKRNNDE